MTAESRKDIKKQGFTLTELLVVISIILIFSSLVLANYRAAEEEFALQRSVHKLAQDLRRAQEMGMAAREIGKNLVPAGQEFVPRGGYGIFFDISTPNLYTLFADCNDNQRYDLGDICGPVDNKFPELVEVIKIERGIKITKLEPASPLHISFKPPNPTTNIRPTDTVAIITLEGKRSVKLRVRATGLIEID